MDDRAGLADFLLARIAEHEEVARAAARRPIVARDSFLVVGPREPVDAVRVLWYQHGDGRTFNGASGEWAEGQALFDRFDPARVLAECEAKRRLIAEILAYEARIDGEWGCCHSAEQIARNECPPTPVDEIPALRLLALPDAGHPDFRPEWRP